MRIAVKAITRSRTESVEGPVDGVYKVRVNTPPVDGAANQRIGELLAKHFGVPKSRVTLLQGQTSNKKLFEIPDANT